MNRTQKLEADVAELNQRLVDRTTVMMRREAALLDLLRRVNRYMKDTEYYEAGWHNYPAMPARSIADEVRAAIK